MTRLRIAQALFAVALSSCVASTPPAPPATAMKVNFSAQQLQSGGQFSSPELRALQQDESQNPGMLWVDSGKKHFDTDCRACHASPRALALALPRATPDGARAENLDDAINQCTTTRLRRPALTPESEHLLSLSAYISHQAQGAFRAYGQESAARGLVDQTNTAAFAYGKTLWFARQGAQDFSCALCHDQNWGLRVLNQTISQGHTVGYPTYRLEWQTLGSAERRIRACYFGMQASVPPPGAQELRALELYAAWRSKGLPLESPAVRP
jgi:L-cysteine S-thiosulfotransferase